MCDTISLPCLVVCFFYACFLCVRYFPLAFFFFFAESLWLRQDADETSRLTLLSCFGEAVFFIHVEKGKNKFQPWQQLIVVPDY